MRIPVEGEYALSPFESSEEGCGTVWPVHYKVSHHDAVCLNAQAELLVPGTRCS